ncbi:MAG TPA: NAD-dependent epimerase/dehydratase family protein [Flavisolibacter sp.]|nr:NAD-dependent epimerase/dehydratase family protein [Flavisolibacter sp.]
MHTILGAGGPVSNALTKELEAHDLPVRLVSRRKVQTNKPTTSWIGADLKDESSLLAAVEGATVIYMCAGLQYDKKVWAVEWPMIIRNVVKAAQLTGARLIFFDNVYMYGHVQGVMTEQTPYHPGSVKGKIRAEVANYLMSEVKKGTIRASIARAADFYGAETKNSFLDMLVLDKYAKGQKAMWMGNPHSLHSFTYVPDAGRALYLLGTHPETDGQVWHMPTAPAMKGIEFMQLAANVLHTQPRYTRLSKLALRLIGLFNKPVGETVELYYQYQYDYVFSSKKIEDYFGIQPTSYRQGIEAAASIPVTPPAPKGESRAAAAR